MFITFVSSLVNFILLLFILDRQIFVVFLLSAIAFRYFLHDETTWELEVKIFYLWRRKAEKKILVLDTFLIERCNSLFSKILQDIKNIEDELNSVESTDTLLSALIHVVLLRRKSIMLHLNYSTMLLYRPKYSCQVCYHLLLWLFKNVIIIFFVLLKWIVFCNFFRFDYIKWFYVFYAVEIIIDFVTLNWY